ncbi:ATP-binding protein [Pasteurellaceae bacterium 20609_3]|uniref:ATP-binding protein n=1 Tax=Spirabiliibacterium mucosae TaxID=28156 RepID=UPI001AAC9229|nr:ATP-binding protein [Spirabiliibacterium mucosae]MBE2898078.1 ATP-binding protein [Spirabiliibacterium mucosae]
MSIIFEHKNLLDMQINIQTKIDHLQRLANTSVYEGVSELIWNSLDADANVIDIHIYKNDLEGIDKITIKDDGVGIEHQLAHDSFGTLGGSWKQNSPKSAQGRGLHGQKGEGRFKGFALGQKITWESTYKEGKSLKKFSITSNKDSLDSVDITDESPVSGVKTGTLVTIENIESKVDSLSKEKLINRLTHIFAGYLYQYSQVEIRVNGEKIDPSVLIELDDTIMLDGDLGKIKLIIWKTKGESDFFLCKDDFSCLCEHNVQQRIRRAGYTYSVYLASQIINELNIANGMGIIDLDDKGKELIDHSIDKLNEYFRKKKAEDDAKRLQNWIDEGIYPYDTSKAITDIEIAERQVFDIVATQVEDNLPKFKTSDIETNNLHLSSFLRL